MPPPRDAFVANARLEGVPSALAAARDAVDALLLDRGPRRTVPQLTAESLLRGAAASGLLEGSGTGLTELRADRGDATAVAAARLNAGLLGLVPVVRRSPVQAFARMHAVAAAGSMPADALGRPRSEPGVADRLQALSRQLLVPTQAPGLAVAALLHAELAVLAPFGALNGIVARAAERLVLVARGVDPTSLAVPEAGHHALEEEYRLALTAYARGDAEGTRRWLLYSCRALAVGVSRSPLAD